MQENQPQEPIPLGDFYPGHPLCRLTWPAMRGFMHLTLRTLGGGKFEATGTRNVPISGGVLICPNHVCEADPCAVAVALRRERRAFYMAKAKLFRRPVLGALLRMHLAFPVESGSPDRRALRHAESLLERGEAVVIFPEGGGNHENTLQPLHGGALLLALRARVPVVPVAIFNTYAMWPYGNPLPHRSGIPVRVVFGEPIDLSDIAGKPGAIDSATFRVADALSKMLNQPNPQPPIRTKPKQ